MTKIEYQSRTKCSRNTTAVKPKSLQRKNLPRTPAVTGIRKIKLNKFILKVIFYCGIQSVVMPILNKSVDFDVTVRSVST